MAIIWTPSPITQRSTVKIVSWNIKGLRSLHKWMKVLRYLKRLQPDVVFLQKTHLKTEDFQRMNKLWVALVFGSSAVGGKAGVFTLIKKHFPFDLKSQRSDTEGRISHIAIKHREISVSLYNIYGPNDDNKAFFSLIDWRPPGECSGRG